jgi:hypothetical protein
MGIHLLHCINGNECIGTHDVVWNTFVTIAWDVDFHVGQKQLHLIISIMFNSFCWWVGIVLTKDGIHTLADVVIINSIQTNLFSPFCTPQGFVTSNVTSTQKQVIATNTLLINSSL